MNDDREPLNFMEFGIFIGSTGVVGRTDRLTISGGLISLFTLIP